ncbi:hypothetical protein MAR_020047 [Mya arenaria]|uniref:Uncharacterized protein n=1 Tax=Mya arenaria TaxID=6604 RepID=A0ABY7E3U2_MYAAR|nr:hypothetical protein MAR_020047 [Mya arenaria]
MDCLNFMLYFLLGEMLQISCCSHSKYYVLPMNFTAEEFQSGKIYCKLGEPLYSDSPETGNMYNYAVTDTDLIRVINDLQREAHSDLLWTGYRNISNTDHTLYAGILQVDSDQRPVIAFIPTDAAANKSFPALCQRDSTELEQVTTKMLLIIYAISSGSGLIIVILVVTIIILKWKSNPSVTKEGPLVVSNATYQDEEATTSNTRGEETQTNGLQYFISEESTSWENSSCQLAAPNIEVNDHGEFVLNDTLDIPSISTEGCAAASSEPSNTSEPSFIVKSLGDCKMATGCNTFGIRESEPKRNVSETVATVLKTKIAWQQTAA